MITYDAIVIGAGHNGLVTAAYLARAGLYVLVLERRRVLGGAAVTEEVFPGFKFDSCASNIGWLQAQIIHDLDLHRHGFELLRPDPTVFSPSPDGDYLLLGGGHDGISAAIRRFSPADAERWAGFSAHVARLTGFLEAIYGITPPKVTGLGRGDLTALLGLGGPLRQLGKHELVEMLRTVPMSVAQFLDEWFEGELLKGTLGASGITGIFQGPYAAGTAYVWLHHMLGGAVGGLRPRGIVEGGMGNLIRALTGAAKRHGVQIRRNAEVERIIVKDDQAVGVALKSGEEIGARRVISNADPRQTFFRLVDPQYLDPDFLRKVRNIKFRGACAKVNLALSEMPAFAGLPVGGPHLRGLITISPSLNYLERAYDDAKYGGVSARPYLEIVIPSVIDPTLAPVGQHVMSILVQYAPFYLKEGAWDDARRQALGERVLITLSEYAPNIKGAVIQRQVLTPLDLEHVFGLTEGNINHGEITLDQILFMRPVPGWAQYRTPIQHLFLCGAGTHPGGGVTGAPGYNAAREILRDLKDTDYRI